MPTKKTCADCGKRMTGGKGALPQGQARCRNCRAKSRPTPVRPAPVPVGGELPCQRCGIAFIRQIKGQRLCWNPCRRRRSGSPAKPYTSTEAGYGAEHQRRRREARAAWQDGDPCARCEGPMHFGQDVDLDHTDDRLGYLGLSHASCNRSSTGRLDSVARPAVCEHCGVAYTARRSYQRYCSVPCFRAAPRPQRRRQERPPRPTRTCATCGDVFPLDGRKRYCSASCRPAPLGRACAVCLRVVLERGRPPKHKPFLCAGCRAEPSEDPALPQADPRLTQFPRVIFGGYVPGGDR